MAENKEIVIHTRFRYKPENSDEYVTVYLESSAKDILVETPIGDFYDGKGTLEDVLKAFEANTSRAPLIMSAETFRLENPVLGKGQIGIAQGTNVIKMGDGITPWRSLKYRLSGGSGSDGEIVDGTTNAVIVDDDGNEIRVTVEEMVVSTDNNLSNGDMYFVVED